MKLIAKPVLFSDLLSHSDMIKHFKTKLQCCGCDLMIIYKLYTWWFPNTQLSHVRRKPVFWVVPPGWTQTGLLSYSLCLEILCVASIILSREWTTKAPIRLHGCASWSASLLFAYDKTGFLMMWLNQMTSYTQSWHTILTFQRYTFSSNDLLL